MRLIDADFLKNIHGMKDDCAECDKELRHKSMSCEFDRVYTLMDFCGWIDDTPTIEPEQRWIPCRERLPETINTYYLITTNRNEIDIGYWLVDEWQTFSDAEVTAWMPLPAPWKGEQP